MIPSNSSNYEITQITYPNRTYKIEFTSENKPVSDVGVLSVRLIADENYDRINGYTDGADALIQTIYLILSSERYQHIIYSWDYGVELVDLIGQPMSYVLSELPRRIRDALFQDDRIEDVIDFTYEKERNRLHITFTVVSNVGNISTAMEVAI